MKTLKKKTSKPWMSLMMFFALLLTFPSFAASQTTRRLQTSEGQKPATQSTAKNIVNDFSGKWKLQTSVQQPDQRLASIDRAVANMGRFKRGMARDKLAKMTTPPTKLEISDTGSHIKLKRSGLEATVPTNGQEVTVKREMGNASMKSGKREGKLIVVSRTANATQTMIYELSADGKSLTQQIQLQSDKLSTPIQYSNRYVR